MTRSSSATDPVRPPMALRWLRRISSLVWWLVLAALVLLALYVGLGRQLVGQIDRYRDTLTTQLADQLGQPVRIEALRGSWEGLDPVVRVDRLRLMDTEEPTERALTLRRLRIRPDVVGSLLAGRLVFRDLSADGLDLTIRQSRGGNLGVDGVRLVRPEKLPIREIIRTEPRIKRLISRAGEWLSNPSIRINQVDLSLAVPGQPDQTFFIPRLVLGFHQGTFRAWGRVMKPRSTTQLLRFHLEGDRFFRGEFNGRLFVDVDSGRLFDPLMQEYSWRGLEVAGFDLSGEGWLHYTDGALQRVNANLEMPWLQLRRNGEDRPPIESVSAQIGWVPASSGPGQMVIEELTWQWDGRKGGPVDAFWARREARDQLWFSELPAGLVMAMAEALAPMPQSLRDTLANYRPGGHLTDVRAQWPAPDGGFTLGAGLDAVSVRAHDGAPGVQNLDGRLSMTARSGTVVADARDMTLSFPKLFRGPWTFRQVESQVRWTIDEGDIRVWSDRIDMDYQQGTTFQGAFDLRLNNPGDDVLSMRIDTRDAQAAMLADFLPARVIDREFYDWLTGAVESGRIAEGRYYGHGNITPGSPDGSFTSSMQYRLEDARIRYQNDWPALVGTDADIAVQGRQARIRVDQAQTGDLALKPSLIRVDGRPDPAIVTVETGGRFDGAAARQWLLASPLSSSLTPLRNLAFSGPFSADVALTLPLSDDASPDLDLTFAPDGMAIRWPDPALSWQSLTGTVRYRSDDGFRAGDLSARFLGEPVRVTLARPSPEAFRLHQQGAIDMGQLSDQLGRALPGLEGRMAYDAVLEAGGGRGPRMRLSSGLDGVQVDWPAPLDKARGAAAPIDLMLDWSTSKARRLSVDWPERLGVRARLPETGPPWVHMTVGGGMVEAPKGAGVRITGQLETLDVADWRSALARLTSDNASGGTALRSASLSVGQFVAGDLSFERLGIEAERLSESWELALSGPDMSGTISIPDGPSEAVDARFDRLALSAGDDASRASATEDDTMPRFLALSVADWPDVDLTVEQLQQGSRNMGRWSLQMRTGTDQLTIDPLTVRTGSMAFEGELSWALSSDRMHESTRLDGRFSGENLADLSAWIDGSIPVRSEKTRAELRLNWPGGPADLDVAELGGDLSFRLENGAILEQGNTAQMFRVFGILNSDTLWRRLQLDFSDLYEAGVTFDAMSGKALIRGGELTWQPEMQIAGPSGAFRLTGRTDLATEALDMELVVVLPLTQNLPLAAVLMGASAPIGGALFVLDKLLGDPLSKLTSATYSVQGTWDQPRVNMKTVFDTGGE
ncbi:uncharacterized protein (TIGR02099 family) [Tamilnaduibacter salinus]|uniref:Uncharacterized protein (TIGR02099 family) n=1 Tax=Tamilnaduibacter salinus TaxID=1484056 RepID=A0A2U1CUV7_9GAMM|nr:YhdP family protein [Tamilnaduibacter salinus]PVY70751.1 uncharacterized protein (TIGR02099 family) [Tamilnaduibacter salinus]